MIPRLQLLVVACALTSCAPALTFRIDPAATAEQRDAVASGIAKWNAVADEKHRMKLDPRGDYLVYFPDEIRADGQTWGGRECTTHTLKDRIVGNENCPVAPSIRVKRAFSGTLLYRVMLHELGHALGLKHIADPRAVMTGGDVIETDSPTETDINECRRVGSCKRKP